MKPLVEDLALRIREKAEAHLPPLWRDRRVQAAAAIVALSLAAWVGASLRGASPARIKFTPAPKLPAAIAGAQERLKANPQDINALLELGLLHFSQGKESYGGIL